MNHWAVSAVGSIGNQIFEHFTEIFFVQTVLDLRQCLAYNLLLGFSQILWLFAFYRLL